MARKFLGAIGISAETSMEGRFMVSIIERETNEPLHFANLMGGPEVAPEQWEFEQALKAAITTG